MPHLYRRLRGRRGCYHHVSIMTTSFIWIGLSFLYFPSFVFAHFLATWKGSKIKTLCKKDTFLMYLAAIANSALATVCIICTVKALKISGFTPGSGRFEMSSHILMSVFSLSYAYQIQTWKSCRFLSLPQRLKLTLVILLSLIGLYIKDVG